MNLESTSLFYPFVYPFGLEFAAFSCGLPITTKPIPAWPDRRSYRAQVRDARRRRNRAKRGAR